jgi:hypothetical protein
MSRHAVAAAFRLELRRRWLLLCFFLGTLAALILATRWVRGEAALLVAVPAVLIGMAGFAAAWGTVANDRVQGRFEAMRGLPVPLVALAHGRLLLVSAWAVVIPMGLVPAVLALDTAGVLPVVPRVIGLWLLVLWTLAILTGIALTALTARWPLERWLSGLFAGVYFLALVAWPWIESRVAPRVWQLSEWLLLNAATPRAGVAALVAVGAVVLLVWWPVARLMAWGMAVAPAGPPERATAFARRDAAGVRAYPPGQRGPVRAVAAMQLRLAMERLPRQAVVIFGTLAVIPFLPANLQSPALIYLRVLAVAIPASVVARVALARSEGTLEPLAALPVPRTTIALGAGVAIAVLALPAAAMIAGATAVARGGQLDPLLLVRTWGALTGTGMLGAGIAAWLTPRALMLFVSVGGVLFFGLIAALVSADAAIFPTVLRVAEWSGAAAGHPVTLVMPLLVGGGIGVALFARGVARLAPAKR